jgi:hypothetical protein
MSEFDNHRFLIITCPNPVCGRRNHIPREWISDAVCAVCHSSLTRQIVRDLQERLRRSDRRARVAVAASLVAVALVLFLVPTFARIVVSGRSPRQGERTAAAAAAAAKKGRQSVTVKKIALAGNIKPGTAPAANDLRNGALVVNRGSGRGLGALSVVNGTPRSATVKLVDPKRQPSVVYEVFVRKGRRARIRHIDPGTYELVYCFGRNWDPQEKRFAEDRSAERDSTPREFIEQVDGKRARVEMSLTLHPVAGGNVRSVSLSPEEFDGLR